MVASKYIFIGLVTVEIGPSIAFVRGIMRKPWLKKILKDNLSYQIMTVSLSRKGSIELKPTGT